MTYKQLLYDIDSMLMEMDQIQTMTIRQSRLRRRLLSLRHAIEFQTVPPSRAQRAVLGFSEAIPRLNP